MSNAFVFVGILVLCVIQPGVLGDDSEDPQLTQENGNGERGSLENGSPEGGPSKATGSEVALNDQGSSEDAPDLLADDADGAVVRSKRYYGCGCFQCNCGTMMPATYRPCGGCCGCGGYG